MLEKVDPLMYQEGDMVKEYRAAKKQGLQKNLTKSDRGVRGLLFKVTG